MSITHPLIAGRAMISSSPQPKIGVAMLTFSSPDRRPRIRVRLTDEPSGALPGSQRQDTQRNSARPALNDRQYRREIGFDPRQNSRFLRCAALPLNKTKRNLSLAPQKIGFTLATIYLT